MAYDSTKNSYAPNASIANITAANATSPANAAYTQADQTALATLANANKTTLNAILAALRAAGIISN